MKRSLKNLATIMVTISTLLVFADQALADIELTTGTPSKAGKIIIRITLKDGKTKDVEVTIPKGTTSTGKATLINNAFQVGEPFTLPPLEQEGNKLIFPPNVKKFEKLLDDTGQTTKLKAVKKQKAKEGQIDGEYIELASVLSGLDGSGNESIFLASLGFNTPSENVFASSQFLFSELPGSDINDWLSAIFTDLQGQLPVVYRSNLSLDLTNDTISFIFPENILPDSSFIESGTNDVSVSSSLDIEVETIPEPTSTLGLLSLGILGAGATIKRQVKRNHSIEKETTKIG
ncbi:MAG: PEP-CTERM sorting domain-containing protein [Microcystis sp. LE19-338.1B]|nr:PEP-CTERM sorting domain-containing protein [Microcystis sp. LE19-338.1B]MCZ8360674.1 PEP-CTERM sorting domain-containing protein [Microcystis sp. LE19-388.1G]